MEYKQGFLINMTQLICFYWYRKHEHKGWKPANAFSHQDVSHSVYLFKVLLRTMVLYLLLSTKIWREYS